MTEGDAALEVTPGEKQKAVDKVADRDSRAKWMRRRV